MTIGMVGLAFADKNGRGSKTGQPRRSDGHVGRQHQERRRAAFTWAASTSSNRERDDGRGDDRRCNWDLGAKCGSPRELSWLTATPRSRTA